MNSETRTIDPALSAKLLHSRHTGVRGTPITMHRALRSINLSRSAVCAIILLPLFFDLMLWLNIESLTTLWADIFNFWIHQLQLDGRVLYTDTGLFGQSLYIPFPDLPMTLPSQGAGIINIAASVLLLILADFIPAKYMPATYVLRAALIIQASASIYFIIHPYQAPYDPADYISGLLAFGLYLMFLVSPLFAMIYYIFDFPFWRKFAATTVTLAYFSIVLPFQYMLHALIISYGSMLFMPVLYLLFGALLNTLMFVSCYAWAMTWRSKAS